LTQASASKPRRIESASHRQVKLGPEVSYHLEIYRARNRLRSASAAANVLLGRALGVADPPPPDAAPSLS
jgi:hypothetical protein